MYSLTALGRSVCPSLRLPTGSSSLEKASGWMRLPMPAAGTMPHILTSRSLGDRLHHFTTAMLVSGRNCRFKIPRPAFGAMLFEGARSGAAADGCECLVTQRQGAENIFGAFRQQNFAARRKKMIQTIPAIADHRRTASRRFE